MHLSLNTEYSEVVAAAKRLAGRTRRTNVIVNQHLNDALGATLMLKCEHTQHTGAFKFRGACNALLQLTPAQRQAGVYTVSSGNHGAALAAAGQQLGIAVTVGVATNASPIKRANMQRYGAELIDIEPGMAAREAFVAAREPSGGIFVPPYDHPHILQGQGTAALELLQEYPELEVLLAPLGGGGLLSGTAIVGKQHQVAKVYGIEPELAADGYASFKTGVLQPAMPPLSICDGLLTRVGEHTFARIKAWVDKILLVNDDQVLQAQALVWEHTQQWIEPSSATVIAAITRYPELFQGKRIGVIISGGNCQRANN